MSDKNMSDKEKLPADDWQHGHEIALNCSGFVQDVEEEWLADEVISCYNCRYRRFIGTGIRCVKSLFPE